MGSIRGIYALYTIHFLKPSRQPRVPVAMGTDKGGRLHSFVRTIVWVIDTAVEERVSITKILTCGCIRSRIMRDVEP